MEPGTSWIFRPRQAPSLGECHCRSSSERLHPKHIQEWSRRLKSERCTYYKPSTIQIMTTLIYDQLTPSILTSYWWRIICLWTTKFGPPFNSTGYKMRNTNKAMSNSGILFMYYIVFNTASESWTKMYMKRWL
jgi:hypothetical protein